MDKREEKNEEKRKEAHELFTGPSQHMSVYNDVSRHLDSAISERATHLILDPGPFPILPEVTSRDYLLESSHVHARTYTT